MIASLCSLPNILAAAKPAPNSTPFTAGIANGNELVFRLAIKPTSSTPKEQESLNWDTEQVEKFSIKGRHDLCVALRAPVIVEAVTALVLIDFMMLEQKIPRIIS